MKTAQGAVGRFIRHSGIYTLGNALNRVGAFLLLPLYTNYLTVAEYGAIELFYAIAAVVSGVLAVGIAHATLRFYFEYQDESDRHGVVSTNLIASLVISLVGVSFVAVAGDLIYEKFFAGSTYRFALQLVLATLVLELSSQVSLAYVRAREYSLLFVGVAVAKLLVQMGANAVLLVGYDAGVEGVLAGNLIAVAVGWLFLTAITVRHCGLAFERDKLMPVLKYSFPFLFSTIVAIVGTNVDRFLVNKLLTLEALGVYALALKFSKLISDLVGEPFNRAYGAFRFTVMEDSNAAQLQARIVRYFAASLAFIALGIIYFTGDVLRVMAQPQFWSAAAYMPLLVIAAVLQVLTYPLQTGILYRKATRHIFEIGLVQAIASVALGYVFIIWLGVFGACITLMVVAVLGLVMTHRISQRYFRVTYEVRRLVTLGGISVVFYLASWLLVGVPVWFAFFGKVVLLAGFAVVMLRSAVFEDGEVARAWAYVAGMRRPGRRAPT